MDEELLTAQMLQRLELHKEQWLATKYDAELNAKVAKRLDDQRMLDNAADQLKRALKALEVIAEEQAQLSSQSQTETV